MLNTIKHDKSQYCFLSHFFSNNDFFRRYKLQLEYKRSEIIKTNKVINQHTQKQQRLKSLSLHSPAIYSYLALFITLLNFRITDFWFQLPLAKLYLSSTSTAKIPAHSTCSISHLNFVYKKWSNNSTIVIRIKIYIQFPQTLTKTQRIMICSHTSWLSPSRN